MNEQKRHILVCDDDADVVRAIEIYLEREGFLVYSAYNGKQALDVLEREPIHLVIMDIMMPLMDGLETLSEIRKTRSIPVILLSAKGEHEDKIAGLMEGADDYVTKPFDAQELIARVKSQFRRYMSYGEYDPEGESEKLILRQDSLVMDIRARTVEVDGTLRNLTPMEFDLLRFLMEHPGEVFSSEAIYEAVWKENPAGSVTTVAVHIRHIREKIEINPRDPRFLKVVWGRGYCIAIQPDPQRERSGQ